MTLEGTNTYVLAAARAERAVVIDAGPPEQKHLDSVVAEAERKGQRIELILLTHGHPDHSGGAPDLGRQLGVPVRALDPAHRLGDEGLDEGDVIEVDGLHIRVIATPGHTADSLCFLLPGADGDISASDASVLTGDTILGRGTTVVAYPDGRLADYLESLKRLQELGEARVLPGHGPELKSAGAAAAYYLAHREERLEQVRAAVAAGDTTRSKLSSGCTPTSTGCCGPPPRCRCAPSWITSAASDACLITWRLRTD